MEGADETPIELHPFTKSQRSLWWIIPRSQPEVSSEISKPAPPHDRSTSQSLRTGAQETVANNANGISEWTRQPQSTALQSTRAVTPKPVEQTVAPAQDHQIAGTGMCIPHDPKTTKTTKAYEDVSVLSQTIRNVRANCLRIARDVIAFDSAEIRNTGGAVIQLGKEWQQYMKVFDDAVQYSQAQAVQVLVIMRNMSSVFGEVEQGDRNDLRLELESFISQMKDKQDDVAGVVMRFNELDGISSMVRRVVQNFLDGDIGNPCQNISSNASRYEGRIRRHEMKKFRQDLGETKAAIADISFKTNFIVNIWQTINSDMRAIYTNVRPKSEGNHMFTKLVVKKLSDANNHLVWFLETYVEQVRAVDME
ncbi:uncharacterized protein LAESUDRAFT_499830 [Laetiporus sulphureus 93-53]|uniref:Uncharacterized protein n=1 Tax=Laetiporus sulphureus 93-53 TaxID=1314785 RepID=A0A165BFZ7_9APHY|nr:uncharacterized protein LAESUDRAFT_499830 [Laetiporus sulphureus 93-53]KZT00977.1 hypothetical protein LAESUDRAFT_499830 [Laetiporus sulphureus 93-53]